MNSRGSGSVGESEKLGSKLDPLMGKAPKGLT